VEYWQLVAAQVNNEYGGISLISSAEVGLMRWLESFM
jgi:hypothetical protein